MMSMAGLKLYNDVLRYNTGNPSNIFLVFNTPKEYTNVLEIVWR